MKNILFFLNLQFFVFLFCHCEESAETTWQSPCQKENSTLGVHADRWIATLYSRFIMTIFRAPSRKLFFTRSDIYLLNLLNKPLICPRCGHPVHNLDKSKKIC